MLLSSVIIILREVLEGALLMSVLLALSAHRNWNFRWSLAALLCGFTGALIYAAEFEKVATWFDYVGPEIINASLHIIIVVFLTGFSLIYQRQENKPGRDNKYTKTAIIFMSTAFALTIIREGSEILLYLSAYLDKSDSLISVMLGGSLGAGIGISIGVLLYYSLTYLIPVYTTKIGFFLLAFFSAGMLSHAVIMLTQADWLPSQHTLWDTSSWLAEDSLIGQLLYAVIGYEATPTALQLAAYITGLALILVFPKLLETGNSLYAKR